MDELWKVVVNSVGAITMAAFFIYYLMKRDTQIRDIVTDAVEKMKGMESSCREHNREIIEHFQEQTREQHRQMQELFSDHLSVTREVITVASDARNESRANTLMTGELRKAIDDLRCDLATIKKSKHD